ncbi:MAG: SRPBCC family protein [Pseudomonadota bacterium]
MRINRRITINAPVSDVWDILGPNYADAGKWNSAVYVSGASQGTQKAASAPVPGRVCQTSLGPFTESIEDYDEASRRIRYSATGDAMPGFVKNLAGHWALKPVNGNQTQVDMTLSADIGFPFNLLMGPMMKMQFNGAVKSTLGDLKHYAETGKPHPRKLKADASKKGIAARQASA